MLIGLMLAFISGCESKQAQPDSFYAFRKQVEKTLSATCDCGPVHKDPINGWIFDVQPRQQREFSIRVWKCEFLTQEELDKNYNSATNHTDPPNQTRDQVARQAAAERWSLPDGSYDSIGISVELQWPEIATAEMEKDREQVAQDIEEIEHLLKPYHRPMNESPYISWPKDWF
jgi:hypothetical protein